jgi:heme o synthase
MKSVAIDLDSNQPELSVKAQSLREKITAYYELIKPRVSFLIVIIAAIGFCLGSQGNIKYLALFHTLTGIALLSAGIAALNQYMERELDARMKRTAIRPLPSGRLTPNQALLFGIFLTLMGEIYLTAFVNSLTAILGIIVIIGYLGLYTPLKTRTSLSTVIGAFPGAMPPMLGWTAARGELGIEAWVLFAILFLWQFPHFLAIAWMYREDYARAGIVMLPVVEPEGHITARQIINNLLLLLPISILPTMVGMSGKVYFYGAIILGLIYLYTGIRAALSKSRIQAKRLLLISVLYLPLLFLLMMLGK